MLFLPLMSHHPIYHNVFWADDGRTKSGSICNRYMQIPSFNTAFHSGTSVLCLHYDLLATSSAFAEVPIHPMFLMLNSNDMTFTFIFYFFCLLFEGRFGVFFSIGVFYGIAHKKIWKCRLREKKRIITTKAADGCWVTITWQAGERCSTGCFHETVEWRGSILIVSCGKWSKPHEYQGSSCSLPE